MSEKYTPVKGDRVRVVLEGEVTYTGTSGGGWFEVDTEPGGAEVFLSKAIAIEKIEPPVEVFKPGDTVQGKRTGNRYSIGQDGCFDHGAGRWQPDAWQRFTTEDFKRVEFK